MKLYIFTPVPDAINYQFFGSEKRAGGKPMTCPRIE
jgi:hypothetical protein